MRATSAHQRQLLAATAVASGDVAAQVRRALVRGDIQATLRERKQMIDALGLRVGVPQVVRDGDVTDTARPSISGEDYGVADAVPRLGMRLTTPA